VILLAFPHYPYNKEGFKQGSIQEKPKKPRVLITILMLVGLTLLPMWAWANMDQSLKNMAFDISRTLPKVEGKVIGVQENKLLIDKGAKDGIREGVVMTVFRQGKPYYHPFTGALLGYAEEQLGTVQVVMVNPTVCWAVEVSVNKHVKPNDKVRISAAKIPIYLFPIVDKSGRGFNIYAFQERLKAYLEDTGRFSVYGENHVIMRVKDASELGLWGAFESMVGKTKGVALIGAIDARSGQYEFEGELYPLRQVGE